MFITGLGTAAPPRRYAQGEGWEAVQKTAAFDSLDTRSRAVLRKVLTGNNGIATRHLALESLSEAFDMTPDVLHARFLKHAPALAGQAAERALADADVRPEEIDALVISTCTGYLCPGLTSYVSPRLGLRSDALMLDLVGQGCGAAIPNLRTAEALISSGRCGRALSICVEVCSAAFYIDNDPGVLISACLFGDGAGAAVLSAQRNGGPRLEWKTSATLLNPDDRDLLRFEQRQGMLRNLLSPQVPALAGQYAKRVVGSLLAKAGYKREGISAWLLHPGGREVLISLRNELGLEPKALRWSEAVLNEYGNVSSSSLFFVMQAALTDSAPRGCWCLSSFGAGFSCHGALVEVGE